MLFIEGAGALVLIRQPSPGHAVPMYAGATNAFSRQESSEAAHWQRGVCGAMPESEGVARSIHHEIRTNGVSQLVTNLGNREIRIGFALNSTLQRDDLETSTGELPRDDPASQAEPNKYNIHFFQS